MLNANANGVLCYAMLCTCGSIWPQLSNLLFHPDDENGNEAAKNLSSGSLDGRYIFFYEDSDFDVEIYPKIKTK